MVDLTAKDTAARRQNKCENRLRTRDAGETVGRCRRSRKTRVRIPLKAATTLFRRADRVDVADGGPPEDGGFVDEA